MLAGKPRPLNVGTAKFATSSGGLCCTIFVIRSELERAVASFRLLWGSRNLELDSGVVLFGRSDDCQLCTDDPLVSRQHARFEISDNQAFVQDLGSRNGVEVNGERIFQRTSLHPGDRIKIGNQLLSFLFGRETGSWSEPPAPTRRFDALGVVGELSEKAIALGRIDEAERLIEGPFLQLTEDVKSGADIASAVVSKATELGIRLAATTLRAVWIDRLVLLYARLGRPWPADVIDALYDIIRKVNDIDRVALREYAGILRTKQLGPADKFLAGRIEGLDRQLGLP